jgi:FHS family L-fucose permease-like MFS transporter
MAIANVQTSEPVRLSSATYGSVLAVVTTLFFVWGSLTSLNDVLIPYAQHVF